MKVLKWRQHWIGESNKCGWFYWTNLSIVRLEWIIKYIIFCECKTYRENTRPVITVSQRSFREFVQGSTYWNLSAKQFCLKKHQIYPEYWSNNPLDLTTFGVKSAPDMLHIVCCSQRLWNLAKSPNTSHTTAHSYLLLIWTKIELSSMAFFVNQPHLTYIELGIKLFKL